MTTNHLPVFLNGRHLAAPMGSTLRSLLAAEAPELHRQLAAGEVSAVDARGLPVEPDSPLSAGAIFRVARSARQAATDDDDDA